jgi:hypothetical protein
MNSGKAWVGQTRDAFGMAGAKPQVASLHLASGQKLGEHLAGGVGPKGRPLRHGDDRGMNPHHAAARIHRPAAGAARVERCRVQYDALDQPSVPSALRTPR